MDGFEWDIQIARRGFEWDSGFEWDIQIARRRFGFEWDIQIVRRRLEDLNGTFRLLDDVWGI